MNQINSPCFEVIAVLHTMRHLYGKNPSVLCATVGAAFDLAAVFTHLHFYSRKVIDLPALIARAAYLFQVLPTSTTVQGCRVLDDLIRGFTELQGSAFMAFLTTGFLTTAGTQTIGALTIGRGRFTAVFTGFA